MQVIRISDKLTATWYAIADKPPDGFHVNPPFLLLEDGEGETFVVYPDEVELIVEFWTQIGQGA